MIMIVHKIIYVQYIVPGSLVPCVLSVS